MREIDLGTSATVRLIEGVRLIRCPLNTGFTSRVFTSGFSGRSASDKRKSRENSCFFNPLKVKRVGKLQWNSH